ncbi:RteC domain-containing protein [Lutibacter sp.]|uniref:RteC domain-containing protein n=1 Tax=Lutibacter sp. TaxID=1925666 RepID=UPI0027323517|nr:RteC domain-containing protein [Lutibacter sp.]MDP3314175.1 RteC domain-containing protein [Lutibacter sp.]
MKKITGIIDNFDIAINNIKKTNLQKLSILKESIKISKECLQQLRLELRKSDFTSVKDEITFFKKQKPYIQGRLNFYLKLNTYLLEFPSVGITKQRNYINRELNKLDIEKSKLLEFIKYYRLEESKLDHFYFLRGNNQLDLFINTNYNSDDPEFSTSHDHLVSQIVTQDLLTKFYAKELETLKTNETNVIVEEVKPTILRDLSWTASKTDLIELLFALHTSGAFQNGNSEIKKLGEICEELFGIELGNIHKTFGQIKAREKDPTKFLDLLKFNLIQKINS